MPRNELDPSYYLEKAPVPKAILHMAVPMIMSMVLDLVYNLVDALFIGRLGNTAMLAAITLAFPFQIVLMGVGQIFGVGGGTLIPRLLGEKKPEAARRASSVNFYLALLSGLFLILVSLPLLGPILAILGARGESLGYTRDFVLILILGSPLIIATMALSETIRGEGASGTSMRGMLLSVAVNIALDPLLIFVLKMGIRGAALATVLANGAAVAYFVWYLSKKSRVQSVSLKDFRPNREMLTAIFSVGSSALLFSSLMIVSSLLFNGYAMAQGASVVAAFGVANRVVQICEFLGMGLFAGSMPLVAFAYAARNRERLNAVLKTTTLAFLGITVLVGAGIYLLRRQIFGLFSPDPGVLEAGYRILDAMLVSVLFSGLSGMITDLFQAFGAGLQSNIMAALRGLALIPIIILGNRLFGLAGVIWSLPAAEILACAVGSGLWLLSRKRMALVPLEAKGL